jgi:hypothetical protein
MNKHIRTFCRNLFTLTGTWKLASSIRRSGIVNVVRHSIHKRNIFVNSEGKIVLPHIDIYVTSRYRI